MDDPENAPHKFGESTLQTNGPTSFLSEPKNSHSEANAGTSLNVTDEVVSTIYEYAEDPVEPTTPAVKAIKQPTDSVDVGLAQTELLSRNAKTPREIISANQHQLSSVRVNDLDRTTHPHDRDSQPPITTPSEAPKQYNLESPTIESIHPTCVVASRINPLDVRVGVPNLAVEGYRNAQWSADGTCLLASTHGTSLYTFVLPQDLEQPSVKFDLEPFATIRSASPIRAFASSPNFTLADSSTCWVATSSTDMPIRMTNAIYPNEMHVTAYRHIDRNTEAYIVPQSLIFNSSGTHLISGSKGLIACHDISKDFDGPSAVFSTLPKTGKKAKWNRPGIRGIVSSLSLSPTGILAAGTFLNDVGLYSNEGRGETISVFSTDDLKMKDADGGSDASQRVGHGITQLRWSPCGNYLVIAGRKSDIAVIYDLRNGKRLSWFRGRHAATQQRLSFDIVSAGGGWEVWAGGSDGCVRVWKNPHEQEGLVSPMAGWKAHNDPVTSTLIHECGRIAATLSMQDRNLESTVQDYASSTSSTESTTDSDSFMSETSSEATSSDTDAEMDVTRPLLSTFNRTSTDRMLKIWSI